VFGALLAAGVLWILADSEVGSTQTSPPEGSAPVSPAAERPDGGAGAGLDVGATGQGATGGGDSVVGIPDEPGAEPVSLEPAEGLARSALTGRVADLDGEPVSGATVTVVAAGRGGEPVRTFLTLLDGRFEFEALEAGRYRVRATAPGCLDAEESVTWPVGAEGPLVLWLASGRTVRGAVVREGGGPAGPGIAVYVDGKRWGVTDNDGNFCLEHLDVGQLRLTAHGEGLVSAEVTALAPGKESLDRVVLGVVQGVGLTVLVRGDGEPVATANVRPIGPGLDDSIDGVGEPGLRSSTDAVQTDELGVATLGGLLPGAQRISVSAHGWLSEEHVVEVEAGGARVVVELNRGARVEGAILFGRAPASGVRLGLARVVDGLEEPEERIETTESEADGGFRFQGLLAGTYRLRSYSSTGGGRTVTLLATATVAKAGVEFLDLRLPSLEEQGGIAGRIQGADPGLRIEVWRHSPDGVEQIRSKTWTDLEGRYRIEGLAAGDYELRLGEGEPVRAVIAAGRTLERDFTVE
jgi:large repetitive protein